MKIYTKEPGCFGSSIMHRVSAPECSACAHVQSCAQRVQQREESTLAIVRNLDERFDTTRIGPVTRWFAERWKKDTVGEELTAAVTFTLEEWQNHGINIYHLSHKTNPIKPDGDKLLRAAFEFILHAGPFKPRDLVEELRDVLPNVAKVKLARIVKRICDALLHVQVLSKEKGILCLT